LPVYKKDYVSWKLPLLPLLPKFKLSDKNYRQSATIFAEGLLSMNKDIGNLHRM
jgi:hypothetical protein